MLESKDIIKLTAPVNARIHIAYKAPWSESKDVILEPGQCLQLVPEYKTFWILREDIAAFEKKYLTEDQYNDPYYFGCSISINKRKLNNNYQIIKKADPGILDLKLPIDKYFFFERYLWHINDPENEVIKNLNLPKFIIDELKKGLGEYNHGQGNITRTELFKTCMELLDNYNEQAR